jgi:membrane fusion protein, multidrug efflux system
VRHKSSGECHWRFHQDRTPLHCARIRFNARETNAALARAGMSVETAVAVSTPDNASPTERGRRIGCAVDPTKDVTERPITKLPEHPGLGRARPQGASGVQVPSDAGR